MNKDRYQYLHRHMNKREPEGQMREMKADEKSRTENGRKKEQVKDA